MKHEPDLIASDRWSSAGDITFYHRNGKCHSRKRSSLTFAATAAQLLALETHRRALAAWRTLEHHVQDEWNALAREVPSHRPPFGVPHHITGHNLFVSAYHGFCTLGQEHVPVPAAFEPLPPFSVQLQSFSMADGSGVGIFLRLRIEAREPGRYALLAKVHLTAMEKGCNPGLMRNVLAVEAGDPAMTERTVRLDVAPMPGDPAAGCTAHLRLVLLDRQRGYRGRYRAYRFPLG